MSILLVVVGIVVGVVLVLGVNVLRRRVPGGNDPAALTRLEQYCRKSA